MDPNDTNPQNDPSTPEHRLVAPAEPTPPQRPVSPRPPAKPLNFFSVFAASLLGFIAGSIVLSVIGGILLIMVIGSLASMEEEVVVPDDAVLQLTLSGAIPEFDNGGSFTQIFSGSSTMSMRDYLEVIERAGDDARIEGIRLQLEGFAGTPSDIEQLSRALKAFRANKKFVYALSDEDGYSEAEYMLAASSADSVYLPASGAIELNGTYVILEFYKPLLDRLNIEPVMVRAGTFKSAVEPFTRESASPELVEALTSVLDAQYGRMKSIIADGRGLSVAHIDTIVSLYPILRPEPALQLRLVDRIVYDDEIEGLFVERTEKSSKGRKPAEGDTLEMLSLDDYRTSDDDDDDDNGSGNRIAVVYAVGSIVSGEGGYSPSPIMGGDQVGSRTFIDAVREAREDDDVKAIVLRIDSPGGGLQPSMAMWREVTLAAKAKPVIVSMGSVAASGGYYIAAPAHEIIAEETTITGSIGVFALAFNMKGLYEETIGINTQVIATGPHADLFAMMRNLTPEEQAFAEKEIGIAYDEFLDVVAEGRKMSRAEVDSVAQGRIWTGSQAKQRGLVDHIGGLELALEHAAAKAKIKSYDIDVYPRQQEPIEQLLEMIGMVSAQEMPRLETSLMDAEASIKRTLRELSGPQVRLTGWSVHGRYGQGN